jgi:predicted PurR-regulated permease PerM
VKFSRDRRHGGAPASATDEAADPGIDEGQLASLFIAPQWLQRLGRQAWLIVGIGIALVGFFWILGLMSSIVTPVVVAAVVAAVASPAVAALQRHRVPRAAGAGLMLLGLLAVAILIIVVVVSGITGESAQIESTASSALDTIEGWLNDAGASSSGTSDASNDLSSAVTGAGSTLLQGLAGGIEKLTSFAFFLSFALFSTFFLLKDGPTIRRWVDRHLGIPAPVAHVITGRVVESLRHYFLGVTIVALFNGVVVWIGALALGVPLAGTIALVTVAGAYVPFIGAFVAGAFAVVITLGSVGSQAALVMLVITLLANGMLQQVVQPIAFGATLELNPLAVLVLTIGAGGLFGMVGMILAAPLASAAVHVSKDLARARAGEQDAGRREPEGATGAEEPAGAG